MSAFCSPGPVHVARAALRTDLTRNRVKVTETSSAHVMSTDHNGKVCMLCNAPLPERINRSAPYTAFRKDCGKYSSATGPSLDVMALPAVQVAGGKAEGFCALNFAKSCADAVANKEGISHKQRHARPFLCMLRTTSTLPRASTFITLR